MTERAWRSSEAYDYACIHAARAYLDAAMDGVMHARKCLDGISDTQYDALGEILSDMDTVDEKLDILGKNTFRGHPGVEDKVI